jgi:hypothetical protein
VGIPTKEEEDGHHLQKKRKKKNVNQNNLKFMFYH